MRRRGTVPTPLTPDEIEQLQHWGRVRDRLDTPEREAGWASLCRKIKAAHEGQYPSDWHAQVLSGLVWNQPGFLAGAGASEAVPGAPPAPAAPERTMLAMQFGDHCWIKNLESRPDLNGHRVVLRQWADAKQRWRCEPQSWNDSDKYIAIRPRNLSKDPVPLWQLATTGRVEAGAQITPENSTVVLRNAKDFDELGIEKPPTPSWDTVASWMTKGGDVWVGRNGKSERAGTGPEIAAELEALIKREGELRKMAVGEAVGHLGTVSVEDTLRHMLCQEALLKAQISLFTLRGELLLVQKGATQLREHLEHMTPVKEAWEKEHAPLDFWEDPEEVPEKDPELQRWAERAANRAGAPTR